MLRLSGAVVLGYIITAVVVFCGLSLLYTVIGAEAAFQPGAYDVSLSWIVMSFVVGFLAALLGGWVARRVGRDVKAPRALAVLVVIIGLALALPVLFGGDADALGPREGAPAMFDAMQNARTPVWVVLVNPLLGALGVLLGGGALRSASLPPEVARAS